MAVFQYCHYTELQLNLDNIFKNLSKLNPKRCINVNFSEMRIKLIITRNSVALIDSLAVIGSSAMLDTLPSCGFDGFHFLYF